MNEYKEIKKMKKANLDVNDIAELLQYILEMDEDTLDIYLEIENKLYDVFEDNNSSFFDFMRDMIERLLPLADVGESPITGDIFRTFSKPIKKNRIALVKMEISNDEL